jgi:hypothetical protein
MHTMSTAVADLLTAAMRLPADSRTELVEAILERSTPTDDFIAGQMEVVSRRMERVRQGITQLVPAAEAHDAVLAGIQTRE